MSDNREAVTITESSTPEEAPQTTEAQVSEQPPVADAQAEATETPSPETDLNLRIEDTPKKTVDEFFENDYERIMQEVVSNGGQYTEELYKEFEDNGHSRTVADRLLAAEVAMAEVRTSKVVAQVGGQEVAEQALQWAAQNLTDSQKSAINKQLQSSDVEVSTMALQSLIAQSGAGSSTVSADTGLTSVAGSFANESEFQDAIRDDRRMSDPTYRQQVMAKLQRSMEQGLINPDRR